jgi:hypothetical protein
LFCAKKRRIAKFMNFRPVENIHQFLNASKFSKTFIWAFCGIPKGCEQKSLEVAFFGKVTSNLLKIRIVEGRGFVNVLFVDAAFDVHGLKHERPPTERLLSSQGRRSATAWSRPTLAEHGYSGHDSVQVSTAGDWRDERDPKTGGDPLFGCRRL